jgi:hypothetical protein
LLSLWEYQSIRHRESPFTLLLVSKEGRINISAIWINLCDSQIIISRQQNTRRLGWNRSRHFHPINHTGVWFVAISLHLLKITRSAVPWEHSVITVRLRERMAICLNKHICSPYDIIQIACSIWSLCKSGRSCSWIPESYSQCTVCKKSWDGQQTQGKHCIRSFAQLTQCWWYMS